MRDARGVVAGLAMLWAGLVSQDVLAQAPATDAEPGSREYAKVADLHAASIVRVEWRLRFDRGEPPLGVGRSLANRGGASSDAPWWASNAHERLIRQERPGESAGYVLSPTTIVTADPQLHDRFVTAIGVRDGDDVIPAKSSGYAIEQNAVFLELERPLKNGKPLAFDAKRAGPLLLTAYQPREGGWIMGVAGAPTRVNTTSGGRRVISGPLEMLLSDAGGAPVGMSFMGELALDESWRGSPAEWPKVSAAEYAALTSKVEAAAATALPRVTLNFRSPRADGERGRNRFRYGQEESADITEWNGSAVLLDERTALVLANLRPAITARLERIALVQEIAGAPVSAAGTFAGTLRDWGGFMVTLDKPLKGAATLAPTEVQRLRDTLLLRAAVEVRGESREIHVERERIMGFDVGWRRLLFPSNPASREQQQMQSATDPSRLHFVFTRAGELVTIPIARRERVASETSRWDPTSGVQATPVAYLRAAIDQGKAGLDPDNAPLSESEENRLAWLGVEMQPMDEELAKINNVADQTQGGSTGAIVSYVYPDSPASKAGIESGDIVLRLNIQGQPKPTEVQIEGSPFEGMMGQFWSQLGQIPEEYLDQIPTPWGSAENSVTRALTDVGFGTAFTIEVFRGGKVLTKEMAVERGPAHYASAARFKSEDAGVSVRELTYEVRRYFQLKNEDPGVIVSKVERGGKAAVAGLKPYEIITSINDTPIASVKDFESAIKLGGELRLSVKRMTEGRIVKLRLDAPKASELGK